jgi:opacity protein-like surface antigen
MRWMSRAVALAAVLTPTLASATLAQRRALAESGPIARRVVTTPPKQQPSPSMTGPDWSLFAGVASGDGAYDVGIAAGGTGRWRRSDWPVGVRGDAYFAHHSGDIGSTFGGVDVSINIFGVMGGAEYTFPIENRLKPYAFGGVGLFYTNVNIDSDGLFEEGDYDSSTDLGFAIGGGIHLTQRLGLEVRLMDINSFTTFPILAVWHF